MKNTKLVATAAILAVGGAVALQSANADRSSDVNYGDPAIGIDTTATQLRDWLCDTGQVTEEAADRVGCATLTQ